MTSNQINFQNLRESIRHNRAMEGYYTGTLSENVRHNKEQEAIGTGQVRASMASAEAAKMGAAASGLSAQAAIAQANAAALRQQEDARHNQVLEEQGWVATNASAFKAQADAGYSESRTKYQNALTPYVHGDKFYGYLSSLIPFASGFTSR